MARYREKIVNLIAIIKAISSTTDDLPPNSRIPLLSDGSLIGSGLLSSHLAGQDEPVEKRTLYQYGLLCHQIMGTLLFTVYAINTMNPHVLEMLYDPLRDLAPIIHLLFCVYSGSGLLAVVLGMGFNLRHPARRLNHCRVVRFLLTRNPKSLIIPITPEKKMTLWRVTYLIYLLVRFLTVETAGLFYTAYILLYWHDMTRSSHGLESIAFCLTTLPLTLSLAFWFVYHLWLTFMTDLFLFLWHFRNMNFSIMRLGQYIGDRPQRKQSAWTSKASEVIELRKLSKSEPQGWGRLKLGDVWLRVEAWSVAYDRLRVSMDSYSQAAAGYFFITTLLTTPCLCCCVFLSLNLHSNPQVRSIAMLGTISVTAFQFLGLIPPSLTNEAIQAPLSTLYSLLPKLRPTSSRQFSLKMNIINFMDLMAGDRLGVSCLDLFVYKQRFSLTVRHQNMLPNFTFLIRSINCIFPHHVHIRF